MERENVIEPSLLRFAYGPLASAQANQISGTVRYRLPLPLGEGWGEGRLKTMADRIVSLTAARRARVSPGGREGMLKTVVRH